ncbi:MAG: hypothetical protein ACTSYI_02075 [Promethearchaeota archaeon]
MGHENRSGGIDEENLNKVAQELKKMGTEVMIVITDVSDRQQIEKLAESPYERFEQIQEDSLKLSKKT